MAQHEIEDTEMRREWEATRALIVAPEKSASIVRAASGDVADAIAEYARIQTAIDRALPDCIQTIKGKQFRKKSYWRAVGTAFNLQLEIREEKLDETSNGWGYLVVYRATAPNGRFADGDGACYASEKTDEMATVHNVRGHAHTRALNRAISNLVGFGEVSAEEVQHDDTARAAPRKVQVAPAKASSSGASKPARAAVGQTDEAHPHPISDAQRKRLWAIWSKRYESECPGGSKESKEANLREILAAHGYEHTTDIQWIHYDVIIQALESWSIASMPADATWEEAQP